MNDMTTMITQSDFQFSGVDVDNLTSSEYTLVTLAIDMSSSVSYYNTELRECIKTIIETCKKRALGRLQSGENPLAGLDKVF